MTSSSSSSSNGSTSEATTGGPGVIPTGAPTGGPGEANTGGTGGGGTGGGTLTQVPQQPPPPPAYVPMFHTGQLPAPNGDAARTIDSTTKDIQRAKAGDLHTFLLDPSSDLRTLNHDGDIFTFIVAVPDSHNVRLLYGPGVGTAGIGQASPVANKFLALHGEGGPALGTPNVMMFATNIRDKVQVLTPDDAAIEQVFQSGNHTVESHVMLARNVPATKEMMKMAALPAYFAYDALIKDVPAALIYERLRGCQHPAPWLDHALDFLRACMVGQFRQGDAKPFVPSPFFTAMPIQEARVWAGQRFRALFPTLTHQGQTAPLPPPPVAGVAPTQPAGAPPVMVQHGPNGAAGSVVSMDAAALHQFFRLAQQGGGSGSAGTSSAKEGDDRLKVSELEKRRMRRMCGLPEDSEAFPHWYRDIQARHLDDKDKLNIIADTLRTTVIFDDAKVPVYPELLKTVKNRDWVASDLGPIASFLNAAKGLSPLGMIDFTLEDIAVMVNEDQDLREANNIAPADLRASRKRLEAKVPTDGAELLKMLKRFANLLFALFTSQSPLYKEVYALIQALRQFSENALKNIPHKSRAAILWILLLQSRHYSKGLMFDGRQPGSILGEFETMKVMLVSKNAAALDHADMPDQLRMDPTATTVAAVGKRDLEAMIAAAAMGQKTTNSGGGKESAEQGTPHTKQQRGSPMRHPWNPELKAALEGPLKDADHPTIGQICHYCGVPKENLIPDAVIGRDCLSHLATGSCKYGDKCRFDHRTSTKKQTAAILAGFERFIKEPLGLKGGKK